MLDSCFGMEHGKWRRRYFLLAVSAFGNTAKSVKVIVLWRNVGLKTVYRWIKDAEQYLLFGPQRRRALKVTLTLSPFLLKRIAVTVTDRKLS